MKVASHQTSFLPWAGFWNKFLASDVFILLAGIDFTKDGDVIHRVRLNGSWLTVPVSVGITKRIIDVRIAGGLPKVAKTIRNTFGKRYPYQERVLQLADIIDGTPWNFLFDLNYHLFMAVVYMLGAKTSIKIDVQTSAKEQSKTQRLFSKVLPHQAPPFWYLAGKATTSYLDPSEIPETVGIFRQEVLPGTSSETILELLASDPKPADKIRASASWLEWGI